MANTVIRDHRADISAARVDLKFNIRHPVNIIRYRKTTASPVADFVTVVETRSLTT